MRLTAPVEIRAADESKPVTISGLAYSGGVIRSPGGGRGLSFVVALDGMSSPDRVQIRAEHGDGLNDIVGSADVEKTGSEIRVAGELIRARFEEFGLAELVASRVPLKLSIGVDVLASREIAEGERLQANGRTFEGPVIFVEKSRLLEISIVAEGADRETAVSIAARSNSMPTTTPNDNQTPEPQTADQLRAAAAERAREESRIAAVTAIAGNHLDIRAQAISEGWDTTRTELAVLRAQRSPGPGVVIHSRGDSIDAPMRDVLCAALLRSCGTPQQFIEGEFSERVLTAADDKRFRRMGITSMIIEAARARDSSLPAGRCTDETIRAAFGGLSAAGGSDFSTVDVSNVLGDFANKRALMGFTHTNVTYRLFAAIGENRDFKPHRRIRLDENFKLESVTAAGEIEHGTLDDAKFETSLATYAKMLSLSRVQIINDDLQMFGEIPMLLGREGARLTDRLVYEAVIGNAGSFFAAGNNNYLAGAATALSVGALQSAEQLFLDMVDVNGEPILVNPKVLVVSTANGVGARAILRSRTLDLAKREAGAPSIPDDQLPTANPFEGEFELAITPWLGSLANGSQLAWYLFGDVMTGPAAVRVVFLDGQQAPVVQSGEMDFNRLGMSFRTYFDVAAALEDPRGAVKMKGEA